VSDSQITDNLTLKTGDLLSAPEQYIAHQCNCVTSRGAHLAKAMFNRFPYADIYSSRTDPDTLGTIVVRGDGQAQRFVINMLGQFYPGRVKYPHSTKDGYKTRQNAFAQCLVRIAEIPDLQSIAFPYMIGCGAAGGDWQIYRAILAKWSKTVDAEIVVYKLEDL
jgi:O-acetyl-ADP-ribose deacetylase (regulator of RNase III)